MDEAGVQNLCSGVIQGLMFYSLKFSDFTLKGGIDKSP